MLSGAYANPRMPKPMLGNADSLFHLPCPEPYQSYYCRNGGQCYGHFEETSSHEQLPEKGKCFWVNLGGFLVDLGGIIR